MIIETTRFGHVEVAPDRVLSFGSGLLGFNDRRDFVLLQPDEEAVFYWLQSTEAPELAFVVTDPAQWVRDYRVSIRPEQLGEVGLSREEDAQILVIANRYDRTITANLQGPLIVNVRSRRGMQMVVCERRWGTKHEIVRMREPAAACA